MFKSLLLPSILAFLAPAALSATLSTRQALGKTGQELTGGSSPANFSDPSITNSSQSTNGDDNPEPIEPETIQILINPDRYVKIYVQVNRVIGLDVTNRMLDAAANGLHARPQSDDLNEFIYNEQSPGAIDRSFHIKNYLVHGPRLTNGDAYYLVNNIFKDWIARRSRIPRKPLGMFAFDVHDWSHPLSVAGGSLHYIPLPSGDGTSSNVTSS